jgi:3',5'-cyclic AMP phosphodiesterase CpdA
VKENEFFFVQISDPQFGMYRPDDEEYEETGLLKNAVARINELAPAFVLCTGDLIDVPCSGKQLAHAQGLLANMDPSIPFMTVPGNHDVGDAPSCGDLDWFRRKVGRDRFSFSHRGWHFIGLNSCLLSDGGHSSGEAELQWNWLEEDLERSAEHSPSGVVVFMHHPLFLNRPDEEDDYFNLPRPTRDRYIDLLGRHGVRTVLAGHLHRCSQATADDLKIVITGPVGMPLGDGYSGFRLIRAGDNGIQPQYFALNDVEGQEKFLTH